MLFILLNRQPATKQGVPYSSLSSPPLRLLFLPGPLFKFEWGACKRRRGQAKAFPPPHSNPSLIPIPLPYPPPSGAHCFGKEGGFGKGKEGGREGGRAYVAATRESETTRKEIAVHTTRSAIPAVTQKSHCRVVVPPSLPPRSKKPSSRLSGAAVRLASEISPLLLLSAD